MTGDRRKFPMTRSAAAGYLKWGVDRSRWTPPLSPFLGDAFFEPAGDGTWRVAAGPTPHRAESAEVELYNALVRELDGAEPGPPDSGPWAEGEIRRKFRLIREYEASVRGSRRS